MSDSGGHGKRDESPTGSISEHSGEEKKVVYRSRSKDVSPGRSRSQTPHKSSRKSKGYSRSRSRSRSYHKTSSYRGGKYRSRSRSRSRHDRRYKSRYSHSRSHSRSRSGSYSPPPRRRGDDRSHSRSPMSSRRRHCGNRVCGKYKENPAPSRCLGVFGLSIYTTEQQLHHIFSKYGPVERVQVVIDAKSGRSRGFCFVYFESSEDAKVAKEQCSGMDIDGRRIRVDFSITQRAHTPTPGIYMGKPTYMEDRWSSRGQRDYGDYYSGGRDSYRRDSYRRSPSPYYRVYRRGRRYDRSRSRSSSPRFEERGIG